MSQEFRSLEEIVAFVVAETQKKLKEKLRAPEPIGALAEKTHRVGKLKEVL